jgi:hypothetical protein
MFTNKLLGCFDIEHSVFKTIEKFIKVKCSYSIPEFSSPWSPDLFHIERENKKKKHEKMITAIATAIYFSNVDIMINMFVYRSGLSCNTRLGGGGCRYEYKIRKIND